MNYMWTSFGGIALVLFMFGDYSGLFLFKWVGFAIISAIAVGSLNKQGVGE